MVFACLALSVFATIPEYEHQATEFLLKMEIFVVIWFTVEFAGRYVITSHFALCFKCMRSKFVAAVGRAAVITSAKPLNGFALELNLLLLLRAQCGISAECSPRGLHSVHLISSPWLRFVFWVRRAAGCGRRDVGRGIRGRTAGLNSSSGRSVS